MSPRKHGFPSTETVFQVALSSCDRVTIQLHPHGQWVLKRLQDREKPYAAYFVLGQLWVLESWTIQCPSHPPTVSSSVHRGVLAQVNTSSKAKPSIYLKRAIMFPPGFCFYNSPDPAPIRQGQVPRALPSCLSLTQTSASPWERPEQNAATWPGPGRSPLPLSHGTLWLR